MFASIRAIAYHLPEAVLTNAALAAEHPEWGVAKIEGKTGIRARHLAAPNETSVDLAVAAGRRLLEQKVVDPAEIDFLLLCTQTPDYLLPTSACLVQDRLGLPPSVGALDFNLGCSGYVYGLGLAKGLVETGQARNVLLVTAETYSKLLDPGDHGVRTIFGDAAAATLVQAVDAATPPIGPFVYGSDGAGAPNLIVRKGGMRALADGESGPPKLHMGGREIFTFTVKAVPELVTATLRKAGLQREDIDLYVFHQANAFMLEHLRGSLEIPEDRFLLSLADCGNTVSSTIPIALHDAAASGRLRPGQRLMLVGFGVGYSWAAAVVRWNPTSAA